MEFKLETTTKNDAFEYLSMLKCFDIRCLDKETYVEIVSLEQLIELYQVTGHRLIVSSFDYGNGEEYVIEICDGLQGIEQIVF